VAGARTGSGARTGPRRHDGLGVASVAGRLRFGRVVLAAAAATRRLPLTQRISDPEREA